MIDYENKSKKVKLYLQEQIEHDNIFIEKKEQISHSLNNFTNPENKTHNIAWAFRVLFNNLLFIGGIFFISSMNDSNNHVYSTQKNILSTTFSEDGKTEYMSALNSVHNPILNSIIENNLTSFRAIKGINYNEKIHYQQNDKILSVSPLELAVIYNRKNFVEFMIKKQPILNVTQIPVFKDSNFNDNNTIYNILTLPQVYENNKTNNFGFESKSLLINNGINIGFNNYEIFRKTIHIPEWKLFWKKYFLQNNNITLYKNLLISELGDKNILLNDIEKIN